MAETRPALDLPKQTFWSTCPETTPENPSPACDMILLPIGHIVLGVTWMRNAKPQRIFAHPKIHWDTSLGGREYESEPWKKKISRVDAYPIASLHIPLKVSMVGQIPLMSQGSHKSKHNPLFVTGWF